MAAPARGGGGPSSSRASGIFTSRSFTSGIRASPSGSPSTTSSPIAGTPTGMSAATAPPGIAATAALPGPGGGGSGSILLRNRIYFRTMARSKYQINIDYVGTNQSYQKRKADNKKPRIFISHQDLTGHKE